MNFEGKDLVFTLVILALEDQRKELEEDFTEQLADMERKLNDARREHTKAGECTLCVCVCVCMHV